MSDEPMRLGFHFDVMSPWAYQTSKWIREVRETIPLDIDWRFFSLEEINREEGKKHRWEREWSYGWGMMRVAAMLRRQSMDDCDRFCEAAGRALHEDSRKPHRPEVAEEICREIGVDPAVVRAAIDDPTTHDDVHADHDAVVNRGGGFGVPTLVFDGERYVYGPVVAPAPTGQDALDLWDLTLAYSKVPGLYEFKTPKTDADMGRIAEVFHGWTPSTETPPPFGKIGEFAAQLAGLAPDALAATVAEVTSSRLDHLRSLDTTVVDAASITLTGVKTYGDFLRIRVFDLWVRARDIAILLGRSLEAGGIGAELTLDEVAGALGCIVGKKVGLPDGRSAVVHVTGDIERDIAVVVDGKARAVESVDDPDVELACDVETFILFAAGRIEPQSRIDDGRITWSGDGEWGERMARNLAYTA